MNGSDTLIIIVLWLADEVIRIFTIALGVIVAGWLKDKFARKR